MIDIHVLTHGGTRQDWLDQCLRSLEGQPVVVHVIQGIEGSVGAGRAKGYQQGCCEFVGYVDSDDYALPGNYESCLAAMDHHRAVVPKEHVEYADGRRHKYTKSAHNGAVYRREDIMPLLGAMIDAPYTVDMLTRRALKPVQLDHIGYVWRVHDTGSHRLITPETIEREKQQWLHFGLASSRLPSIWTGSILLRCRRPRPTVTSLPMQAPTTPNLVDGKFRQGPRLRLLSQAS